MTNKLANITSEKYRCEFEGSCYTIFKSCNWDASCPTVIEDGDKFIIIGKIASVNDYPILAGRIGVDEIAIEIPADLIKAVFPK
jgi:hypothetical protein